MREFAGMLTAGTNRNSKESPHVPQKRTQKGLSKTTKNYLATQFWRALGIRHPAFERVLPLRAKEPPGKHQGVYGSRGLSRLKPTHPKHSAVSRSITECLGIG